jgi:predicted nucleotidyltransferase
MTANWDVRLEAAGAAASRTPGIRLLVFFGSRAVGREHRDSDWDFGYLADAGTVTDGLHADLIRLLNTERVDLVDLGSAGGLLRYRAAASGRPLFEREAGEFDRFWLEAVDFWCDVEPILRPAYDRVLDRLGP